MKKWVGHIRFINAWEQKYNRDEIDLQEMCKGILNSFYNMGWISEKPGSNGEYQEVCKTGIPTEAMEELEEIVYGGLHTIAYQDEIYGEDEDRPDIDDYDYWKSDLYDWCDEYNVWLEPTCSV